MSDEEKFTNRHGHTISAFKETANDLPEPDYKTATPTPVKRRKRRSFHLSPLGWKIVVISIAVIVLVPVLVGEIARGAYSSNVSSAKNSISKLFDSVLAQQKSGVTSKTLTDTESQLASIRDGLCPGGFLDNIAKLYPRAQKAYDDCAAYKSSVATLTDLVGSAADQMTYLEQLQPLLSVVSKPLEDQFAVLSSQQENWQSFVDGLKQLSVPAAFSSAHAGLVTQASAIRDQWIALVQATNNYDSAAFRAAEAKLTESSTAFRAQTTGFSEAVATTQTSITSAVTTLK